MKIWLNLIFILFGILPYIIFSIVQFIGILLEKIGRNVSEYLEKAMKATE